MIPVGNDGGFSTPFSWSASARSWPLGQFCPTYHSPSGYGVRALETGGGFEFFLTFLSYAIFAGS